MREIALFVEDDGHRQIIGPLVQRLAREGNVEVRLDWRNARRGHPGATASAREGLTETLTVVEPTGALQRTVRSTNAIENLNGSVQRYTRNVKRWRAGEMIQRWISAALPVRGFRDMPRLMSVLEHHCRVTTDLGRLSVSIAS